MTAPNRSEKKQAVRLDLSTFVGLLVSAGCIIGGLIFEGGKIGDVSQATAALIVLGGTLGAVLVTTPFETFLSALKRSRQAFTVYSQPFTQTMEDLLRFAEGARKSGIGSLEKCAPLENDPFFAKALNLAADGTDAAKLRDMMLLDLDFEQERVDSDIKVIESAAGYSPTIGIIGAVLGLIQVMKHLENLGEVGRGIAVAFVATVYGVAAANLLFLPIAGKLKARSRELESLHELMIEGVVAIVEGINPRLIRIKLAPFFPACRESRKSSAVRLHDSAGSRTRVALDSPTRVAMDARLMVSQ